MRLERLTLAPYGRFADRTLALSAGAALHVVLGANESGKTTALSAIGDLLFGFPQQTPYGFAHDQRSLRIGGLLRFADGSQLSARRRKGRGNTLLDDDDKPLAEDALARALGAVDRKMFEEEFGLTSEALREGGRALLKAGGSLAETLAAGSAGLTALTQIRDRLKEEADSLFSPRRSAGKTFWQVSERHDAADARLRVAIVTADALKSADEAVLAAQAQKNAVEAEHEEAGHELARWRRVQRTTAKLAEIDARERELEFFADLPPIAAEMLQAAQAARAQDEALREELDRLRAEAARDADASEALSVPPALLAQGEAIDTLMGNLNVVRKGQDDLPRRIEAHQQHQAALDALARRIGFADHAAFAATPPNDAALARARKLIEARRRAEERRDETLVSLEKARTEMARLQTLAPSAPRDPEPFKRRLAAMAPAMADADRLRLARAAASAEARALADEVSRLDPDPKSLDALAREPLPEEGEVAEFARRAEEAAQASRTLEAQRADAKRALQATEASLAKLERQGASATREDWAAARARREDGFARLLLAFDDPDGRAERFDAVRALAAGADAIAEILLVDTGRAARIASEREAVAARREALSALESDAARLEERAKIFAEQWRALWAASGLAPREPAAMASWLKRAAALLTRRAELARRAVETEALAAKVAEAHRGLTALLAEFGGAAASDSFEGAHREANVRLEDLQRAYRAAESVAADRLRAEKDAAEAAEAQTRQSAALEAIMAEWRTAMPALALRANAGPEEASAALSAWEAVATPRELMQREQRSIAGIRDDLEAFERGVAMAVIAAPDFADAAAATTLTRLHQALIEARQAERERERLTKAATARGRTQAELEARRAALASKLGEAKAALGVDDDGLADALRQAQRRQEIVAARAAAREDLRAAADGLDEAALRAERASVDVALAEGQIALCRQRQEQALQAVGQAAVAVREAEGRVDTLMQGRGAADAARERADASAELIDVANRWIGRQAAARLATRAIERHRAAAQDPLVARAGSLFAVATSGAFVGLGADYDETDRPVLVARRAGGGVVGVEGLSEGTRDQLFLSLRLALLERRGGEPLPFIGDDLLHSFDDARALAMLGVLAEFGAKRQVLLFTHHRHVADLARGLGDARVEVVEL